MHLEIKTPAKEMVQLNESLVIQERRLSCLEEDLALSSSTHDTTSEKTTTEQEDKLLDEETQSSDSPATTTTTRTYAETSEPDRQSYEPIIPKPVDPTVVYEDAMDCNYDESSSATTATTNNITTAVVPTTITTNLQLWTNSRQFELPDAETSPEMFCESDADDEAESTNTTTATTTTTTYPTINTLEEPAGLTISQFSPVKLNKEEMIYKADKYLLRQVNKYLSGVPPPPGHTISQKDCDDFLGYIKQNRSYFWADPFLLEDEKKEIVDAPIASSSQLTESLQQNPSQDSTIVEKKQTHPKAGMRNLSMAFDECERSSHNESSILDTDELDATTCTFNLSDSIFNSSLLSMSAFAPTQSSIAEVSDEKLDDVSDNKDKDSPFNLSLLSTSTFVPTQSTVENEDSRLGDNSYSKDCLPTLYTSCTIEEAKTLEWPNVFKHRCHEIYYNRNRATEDFENLRMKLCDRYIGAETQSTCNVWFAKQVPGSARKRSLLAKRNNGQSPGKRLSYLAKRRRTFSSANLQVLNFPERKLMLNVKRGPSRKGKSPRRKSPKGKSPRRKTPRSSAKKRIIRRLQLEGPSPRKAKIDTSKRALFQSPPLDKPGPSRETVATATSALSSGAINNPKKIKRALFQRTPKKNEAVDNESETLSYPESRKRKSDEELEHTRHKWAKSLSFDTAQNLENSSSNANPLRHSTNSVTSKYNSSNKDGKTELSEAHRKKLLWAVAEALRSKGIGMNHPQFKPFASSLAKTVRKFMPDLENKNIPRKPGSTSDRMIKIAKRHVLLIIESSKTESTS